MAYRLQVERADLQGRMYAGGMATDRDLPTEGPIRGRMVRLPTPPPGGFTAADLPRLIEVVDTNFEILDGEVVVMAPATHWHNRAIALLWHALEQIAPRSMVVAMEQGIDLGESIPVPDLLIVSREAVKAESLYFQPHQVHLAIEVVSPGTVTKDRRLRPSQYEAVGIECFWRVENEGDAMVVYAFEDAPGGYKATGVHRGRLTTGRPFPIDIELPEVTW
jgi:Uma2 family endonuclease